MKEIEITEKACFIFIIILFVFALILINKYESEYEKQEKIFNEYFKIKE